MVFKGGIRPSVVPSGWSSSGAGSYKTATFKNSTTDYVGFQNDYEPAGGGCIVRDVAINLTRTAISCQSGDDNNKVKIRLVLFDANSGAQIGVSGYESFKVSDSAKPGTYTFGNLNLAGTVPLVVRIDCERDDAYSWFNHRAELSNISMDYIRTPIVYSGAYKLQPDGSLVPGNEWGNLTGNNYPSDGGSTTFTATANSDYEFAYFLVDGTQVYSNPYTLSGITLDHSIVAVFRQPQKPSYTLNLYSNDSNLGSVRFSGTTVATNVYDYGSTVTLVATPAVNANFQYWKDSSGNIISTDTRVSVVVYGNASYTAYFVRQSYTVQFDTSGASHQIASQVISLNEFANLNPVPDGFNKSITLSYNADGGNCKANDTLSGSFVGWFDTSNAVVGATNPAFGDKTLPIGQVLTPDKFNASFYANLYGDLMNAFGYNKQSLVNHYSTNGLNEGRFVTFDKMPEEWKPSYDRLTLETFPDGASVANLSSAGSSVTLRAIFRAKFTLPTPTKSGYSFLGWYDQNGNRIGLGGTDYEITDSTTIYARWQKNPEIVFVDIKTLKNDTTQISDSSKIDAGQGFIIKVRVELQ